METYVESSSGAVGDVGFTADEADVEPTGRRYRKRAKRIAWSERVTLKRRFQSGEAAEML